MYLGFLIKAAVGSDAAESRVLSKPSGMMSRIINGIEATPYEFPHQAALLSVSSTGGSHMCGASVIAQDWVITAAHCVEGR